jgi:hypothetical protein
VIGRTRNDSDKFIFLKRSSATEDDNGENLRNVGHKLYIDTAGQDSIAYSRCESVKQCKISPLLEIRQPRSTNILNALIKLAI